MQVRFSPLAPCSGTASEKHFADGVGILGGMIGWVLARRQQKTRRNPDKPSSFVSSAIGMPSGSLGSDRREAVELYRRLARRISAGREKIDGIADLQIERQGTVRPLIEHIRAIAGGTGENHALACASATTLGPPLASPS